MRVRYTIPGWQPTMPRGLAPVRPPVAFREMLQSRQGVPDSDWKAPLRAAPKQTLAPALEAPAVPRGVDLRNAEYTRGGIRAILAKLPVHTGPALEQLRNLLAEQASFESRVMVRASATSFRS